MKKINKQQNVHLRISDNEKRKYQAAAAEVGLTLSGFFRYSAAIALSSIKNQK